MSPLMITSPIAVKYATEIKEAAKHGANTPHAIERSLFMAIHQKATDLLSILENSIKTESTEDI